LPYFGDGLSRWLTHDLPSNDPTHDAAMVVALGAIGNAHYEQVEYVKALEFCR
jgi:hypothetical protein